MQLDYERGAAIPMQFENFIVTGFEARAGPRGGMQEWAWLRCPHCRDKRAVSVPASRVKSKRPRAAAAHLEVCPEAGGRGGEGKAEGNEAGKGDGAGDVKGSGKKVDHWVSYAPVVAAPAKVMGYEEARATIASFAFKG